MAFFSLFRRLLVLGAFGFALLALAGCSSSEDRAKAHFERGNEFIAQGDPIKASLEFRNALKLKAAYPEALFALGQAQESQGAYTDALRSYIGVAEQVPEHVEARVRLSYILLAGDQTDEAAKYADQAAALAKDDPSVMVVQAAVAMKRGEAEKGVELAKAALAADPESVDALMVLASERMLKTDPAGALSFLEQAPPTSERNVGLQVLRLTALDALDDQPAVEDLFGKLITLFPETPAFRDSLVRWYMSKNRPEDAERVVRQHADENPNDDEARLRLVGLLASSKGTDAALAELQDAVAKRTSAAGDTFALRMALAQLQAGAGKGAEAVTLLQTVVAETTDAEKRNQARVQLARLLAGQGDPDGAAATVEAVVSEDANNVDALSVRASLRLLKGDTADAITDLLTALNEAPDNFALHGLLAEAYERDGSIVLAEEQYAKALDLNQYAPRTGLPAARFFIKYGKTDQAIRTLETVRRRAPADREVLGLLAQLKLSTRDWLGAQQIAETLRQLGEQQDQSAADRIGAAALVGLNRYDDSIELLQSAIDGEGNRQQVLPDLISAYMQSGKQDAAIAYLQDLIEKDPADVQALILLGSVYLRAGDEKLAEETLQKAADDAKGLDGDVALAQYYISTGKNDEAETVINSALEQEPDNAVLRLLLGALYERSQRFDDAIAVYQALYEQNPTATNVANDLASLISERRGDAAALDQAFEIAQRLRGSDIPQYLDTLGWIHYLRGEYDEALPLLRSAASRLVNVPLVHYHLGMTYNALGQSDLAIESLESAVAMTPPLIAADMERATDALQALRAAPAAEPEPAAAADQPT